MKGEKIMARVPMVTRTIVATKVNVLCLNIETAEPFNKDITLSGTFKDSKSLMKAVEKVVNSDAEKAVHVVANEEVETLYGMTEQKFIELAEVLPPRGKKEEQENQ